VGTYEITLPFPDRPYDEHLPFLREVAKSTLSGLIAYHRYREGIVLTIQVETDRGRGMAMDLARQRAASFWPSYVPAETTVEDPIAEAG
jgi:hypothetical protein